MGPQQSHRLPYLPLVVPEDRVTSLLETIWNHCSRLKAAFPQCTADLQLPHLCLRTSVCKNRPLTSRNHLHLSEGTFATCLLDLFLNSSACSSKLSFCSCKHCSALLDLFWEHKSCLPCMFVLFASSPEGPAPTVPNFRPHFLKCTAQGWVYHTGVNK